MSAAHSVPGGEAPADGPFISFSINYEDVVLRRLFRERGSGFFVDVGAEHPIVGNDFYGLYTRGWSGINIEPNPSYFALLQEQRPRDTNLQLALSDVAGQELTYFEVENTGLSTCDETQVAACLAKGYAVKRHDIRSSTLKDVLASIDVPHIDILKVDVEGLEERVLLGNDWDRYRPSVIMVEVTYPQTSMRRPTGIRRSLEALGYRHVHFDNLNDFFAEAGFAVPADMTLPPNVFDNFIMHDIVALREDNASIRTNFQAAETYAHALETEYASLEVERDALRAERASLHDALGHAAADVDALGREKTLLQRHGTVLEEALDQKDAVAAAARRFAVAAILGRSGQLRSLLAAGSEPEQEEGQAMPEQSRQLVTIAGEGVTDGREPPEPPMPVGIRVEMMAAQLQASNEENGRHLNDVADLTHENRRLLASLRQAQGENLSLQRALGPSYAIRDELFQLRETIAALQTELGQHHRAMSSDFEARVCAALDERIALLAMRNGPVEAPTQPDPAESPDTVLLNAMLASTSWRVTRPLRALRSLFGAARR